MYLISLFVTLFEASIQCRLNELPHTIYWKIPIVCRATLYRYALSKIVELFANSRDPDRTPRFVASDLGLHCFSITILGVFRLHWVKTYDELATA